VFILIGWHRITRFLLNSSEIATVDEQVPRALAWRPPCRGGNDRRIGAIMADFCELGGGFGALLPTLQEFGPGIQEPRMEEMRTAAVVLDIFRTITEQNA